MPMKMTLILQMRCRRSWLRLLLTSKKMTRIAEFVYDMGGLCIRD
jgi:hypothetical protein